LRPFSSLLKPQKMKPWRNAPDCDEPTVDALLTVPKIGFYRPLEQPARSGGKRPRSRNAAAPTPSTNGFFAV
jgi:hypothetical protein